MFEVTIACFLRDKACNLVYLEDIDGAVTCWGKMLRIVSEMPFDAWLRFEKWRKIIDTAYKENGGKKNEKRYY